MIREDEWRDELERLAEAWRTSRQSDGLTGPEWARKLGMNVNAARSLLTEAKSRGLLVVGKGVREALDGRLSRVVVYAMRKPVSDSSPTRKAARRVRRG